jgi:hypothetical protein
MPIAALIALGVVILALSAGLWAGLRAYRRFRGRMLVTCPETDRRAGVTVDAVHAGLTAMTGHPGLRLSTCTRWPERRDCGQECLAQAERSPEHCLVRRMLAEWYRERSCALCGKGFARVDSYDHEVVWWYDKKPALLSPDGRIVTWHDLPVETLPDVLATHRAVCWDCVIVDTLRRIRPDRVVMRPAKWDRLV